MNSRRWTLAVIATLMAWGCAEDGASPNAALAPSFAVGGVGRPSVLVNHKSNDNGTAKTIMEGIEMVAEGGTVMVLPGTYNEGIVIDKGLTLEGIATSGEPTIVAPNPGPDAAIDIVTTDAVVIRNLTVHHAGFVGVRGVGPVNVTVERATITGPSRGGVVVINDGAAGRARLAVRDSRIEGPTPDPRVSQQGGISGFGDVDVLIERNTVRGSGGACIIVLTRLDLAGETNGDIMDNDVDGCGEAGGIRVGRRLPAPTGPPATATGVVNVIGNTIRNTPASCVSRTGINWEALGGRIEHNSILGYVPACAGAGPRALPTAIWVGSLAVVHPQATPVVRFNDIEGNAQAGLRVAPNMTTALDARCNWWGSAGGPSGAGSGSGDAVVAEAGAATPVFMPFATRPIAGTQATSC